MACIIKDICNLEDEVVDILIGDKLHLVKKVLLTKYQDSLFVELVEKEDYPTAVVHFDRDARHFDSILNFLRGELNLNNWTRKELDELSAEASYYKLTDLTDQIEDQISHRDWTQPILDESNVSVIHTQMFTLMKTLKYCKKQSFVLEIPKSTKLDICGLLKEVSSVLEKFKELFEIRFFLADESNYILSRYDCSTSELISLDNELDKESTWSIACEVKGYIIERLLESQIENANSTDK